MKIFKKILERLDIKMDEARAIECDCHAMKLHSRALWGLNFIHRESIFTYKKGCKRYNSRVYTNTYNQRRHAIPRKFRFTAGPVSDSLFISPTGFSEFFSKSKLPPHKQMHT